MANFAQTAPIQYKDYVQVSPVEAMTMVGMQREQKLQEGIATVNNYVQKVAGIDILRDADKQYLSNNLTNLKSGITKNLSGDYSDSRIVNQITGAASKIYKDPVIQRAMVSTAAARRGLAEMDEARKKGENGPSNDAEFNKRLMQYSQSTDQESAFNYNYEKYTDVNKHVMDIVGKLHKSGTLTDEAFENVYDASGKVTGRRLSESTIRNGFEGVKPDQIRAALRAGLSPQDWRQLELDGVYQYSNMSDDQFVNATQKSYEEAAQTIQQKLKYLDGVSTTSGAEKAAIEDKRQNLLQELNYLKNEYDGVTSTFASGDVDAGKAKLHTLRSINNLATSLSYGETTSIYQGDTPQQAERWRQENAQKLAQWQLEHNQKERFHNDNLEQAKLANKLKEKELEPSFGSLGGPIDKDAIPELTFDKFVDINQGIKKQIDADRNSFIAKNELNPNSHEGRAFYAQKKAAYETKPNSLSPIEREFFKAQEERETEYDSNITTATKLTQEIDAGHRKITDFIPKGAPEVEYSTPEGRTRFTSQDFVNFNEKFDKYITVTPGVVTGSGSTGNTKINYDREKAKAELTAKEFKLFEILASDKRTPAQEKLLEQSKFYQNNVNAPYKKELEAKRLAIDKAIQDKVLINQSTSTGIPLINPTTKNQADNLMTQFAQYAAEHNGKIGNTTSEDLNKLLKDPDKTFVFHTSRATKFQPAVNKLVVTSSDGSVHEIPMTETQRQNVFKNQYTATPAQQAFEPIADQLQKSGGFTTKNGPKPYLGQSKFPKVISYAVNGDVEKSPTSGQYSLKLTITDPVSGKRIPDIPWPPEGTISEEGVVTALNRLSDAEVFEIIHGNPPTQAQLAELKKASQK